MNYRKMFLPLVDGDDTGLGDGLQIGKELLEE